jgi:phosphoenolpyruvate phosphomutase
LSKERNLNALLKKPGLIRLAGAHNALGAKLVERAGFDGVWSSGLEISASYGVPDAGILTMSEFLMAAQSMVSAVQIPVVADCDTGFGNSNNVIYAVQKFEAAGVAAICIEDKLFPKLNSFTPGLQELTSVAEFVGKIMAAKNAQRGNQFMVIARTEAFIAGCGQDEALRRAYAYAEAGADMILVHDRSNSPVSIINFIQAWDFCAPLAVIPTTYYTVTSRELEELGVKMVIYANQGLRASITAMTNSFAEILNSGSTSSIEDKIAPLSMVLELQGLPGRVHDERSFPPGIKHVRAIIPAAGDHMNEYSMKSIAEDIPMAMLDINGKSLLRHQVEMLNLLEVRDIVVVGGYKREKIKEDGIKLIANQEWQATGEMASILCADNSHEFFTLIAFSDLLFERELLEKLLKSERDITILVDTTCRKGHATKCGSDLVKIASTQDEANESPNESRLGRVVRIGKNHLSEEADGEFIGLALFSARGFKLLRQAYETGCLQLENVSFHEAQTPQKASLTDVLQELICQDHEVNSIEISSGWREINSFEDYRTACHRVRH